MHRNDALSSTRRVFVRCVRALCKVTTNMPRGKRPKQLNEAQNYSYSEADHPLRPDVGTQAQFRKKKPPATYRYDSSLSPALDWDGNLNREKGEALIRQILEAESLEQAKAAAAKLKAMSQPLLNWAGKAERVSLDVPTLPLFVHERLSTKAIIETLKGHKKGGNQLNLFDLFGDSQRSITDQVLKAYEHRDSWTNRMILGDSLMVMNSLLQYEGLGGQVQMIYIDPPYGVKFGSNFQPFVRKRDVKHNEDDDLTREPEMVKAYRDTWELGLHSYLTYLRDRLLLARDLLTPSGSIFVQISDENLHHVRELMDEVFGRENFCSVISFKKTGAFSTTLLPSIGDYILWYAKDINTVKYNQLFEPKVLGEGSGERYTSLELPDGIVRPITEEELENPSLLPRGSRLFLGSPLTSDGAASSLQEFEFESKIYKPKPNQHWKTSIEGLKRLAEAKRIFATRNFLNYKLYLDDFPFIPLTNIWTDTMGTAERNKIYVVQTATKIIQRCLLMTTDPGDLILDPTCGSGTTANVAEQWGRRWITCDVSRVPLALARQRLLTATFPWYELKDESRGPAGGFVYKRKQNSKGEEIGGIVPHVTLKSIANNEPPEQEVLVDRPETTNRTTRVTGPFTFEATIPALVDWEDQEQEDNAANTLDGYGSFVDRMLEVLRKSPVLRLDGNRTITFQNVRRPAKSLSLLAEAMVKASDLSNSTLTDVVNETLEQNANQLPLSLKSVAFVFGPENGAIAEKLVYEAAKEANGKHYTHLYVIGFAIQANARKLIESCDDVMGIPATYVQATPDLLMGDLLKNMRSSQIFSVCGLPEVRIHAADEGRYRVELLGLDVFDPITMEVDHRRGNDVAAWFLDTDYNGLCFHVCQAFFPRTSAWDGLKKALRGTYEDSVWEHLAGALSTPFETGEHGQIAVKAIDDRGNELLVVKSLQETRS